jgi:hypothetical protein
MVAQECPGRPGLACQTILELRSEEQEIRYTRNSYTKIGDGEVERTVMGRWQVRRIPAAAIIQIC